MSRSFMVSAYIHNILIKETRHSEGSLSLSVNCRLFLNLVNNIVEEVLVSTQHGGSPYRNI